MLCYSHCCNPNYECHPKPVLLYSKPREEPEETTPGTEDNDDESSSTADVKDPNEYEEVFKPKSRLGKYLRSNLINLYINHICLVVLCYFT